MPQDLLGSAYSTNRIKGQVTRLALSVRQPVCILPGPDCVFLLRENLMPDAFTTGECPFDQFRRGGWAIHFP